jgi:hypothetical protein
MTPSDIPRESREHADACHLRWYPRRNRQPENPEYKDEWYAEQCGGCSYYVRLTGHFEDDYGACTNAKSSCDGRVMFEHDGCDQFQDAGGWDYGAGESTKKQR